MLGQPRRQAGGGRPRLGLALLDSLCDLVEPRAGLLADGLDALRERVGERIGERSASASMLELKARWSAATGSTYQRISFRRTHLTGIRA